MAADDELSAEQMEKLLQFQDLTGMDDLNEIREVLQRHSWDLEIAVQDQLNIHEGRPSVFNQDQPIRDIPPINDHDELIPLGGHIIPARAPNQSLVNYVISIVYNVITQTIWSMFSFVSRIFQRDQRRRIAPDPVEDVENFIERFSQQYSAVEACPVFWRSSYNQALAAAKQELKFLLIYLHCADHQHTDAFCRKTLCSAALNDYLRQTNWLLWGCDVARSEGYRVSQALRENSYPFLAVAVLRGARMTVVSRLEGPVTAEDLVTTLRNIVTENEMSLVAARAERNERSFTQSLRRQQDEAYQESLLADQEKERKRQEEQRVIEEEEERLREEERERHRKKENIARLKVELADQIPPEPENDHQTAVHLVIKLPSGKRLERRFLPHHSLQDVYYYVFCHPESPDEFEIATNFPKRVLPCKPTDDQPVVLSLDEVGLRGKQALFVYDLDA